MSDIAKKYVKALINSMDDKEITSLSEGFDNITGAFKNSKFISIIQAPEISKEKKAEFISNLIDTKDQKIINFIKLLCVNDRIEEIPTIAAELKDRIALKNNTFNGILISGKKVSEDKLKDIEAVLSKKFDSTIKLENRVEDYNGMKVEIESLGVEIGLSTDRLKQQIAQTILSAI